MWIYSLRDPAGQCCYIGITRSLTHRSYVHRSKHRDLSMVPLARCRSWREASDLEGLLIRSMIDKGFSLRNKSRLPKV